MAFSFFYPSDLRPEKHRPRLPRLSLRATAFFRRLFWGLTSRSTIFLSSSLSLGRRNRIDLLPAAGCPTEESSSLFSFGRGRDQSHFTLLVFIGRRPPPHRRDLSSFIFFFPNSGVSRSIGFLSSMCF